VLISEILYWNNEPTEAHRSDPQLGPAYASFSDDPTNLVNAFTRGGLVKHFWNLNGSEEQPSGPAAPDAENELIPSGMLEPTTASWEAEPLENEPTMGQHRLIPFRQYRGISGG
jgi:hypothetical protein